ncbi:hypothetical protein ACEPAH_2007 [Sanghuangporus vaninii]
MLIPAGAQKAEGRAHNSDVSDNLTFVFSPGGLCRMRREDVTHTRFQRTSARSPEDLARRAPGYSSEMVKRPSSAGKAIRTPRNEAQGARD